MCVDRALIAGGGAPEIELSIQLMEYAQGLAGVEQYCFRAFADALEIIPFTLAENAGLNPIATVTELRNRHSQGEKTSGINVRKVRYGFILDHLHTWDPRRGSAWVSPVTVKLP